MLTPAFHFNILEAFLPAMNEQSNNMVNLIRQQVKLDTPEKGVVLDVVPYITYAALDVICGKCAHFVPQSKAILTKIYNDI